MLVARPLGEALGGHDGFRQLEPGEFLPCRLLEEAAAAALAHDAVDRLEQFVRHHNVSPEEAALAACERVRDGWLEVVSGN